MGRGDAAVMKRAMQVERTPAAGGTTSPTVTRQDDTDRRGPDQGTGLAAWPTRVQRCGIDSACGCPPEEKAAAVAQDLQVAASTSGGGAEARTKDLSAGRVPTGGEADHLPAAVQACPEAGAPVPQPGLTISRPGDADEQEADRVADHVVSSTDFGRVRGECAACTEDGASRPTCAQGRQPVQPKEMPGQAPPHSADLGNPIGGLRGPGQPLAASTRADFESRFERDFSAVRVHTGHDASESARSIQARAYTWGRDVVFGNGEFAPDSRTGQRLLAHELAHVIQQGHAPKLPKQDQPSTGNQNGGTPAEPAARIARQADAGSPAGSHSSAPAPQTSSAQRDDAFGELGKVPAGGSFGFPSAQPAERLRFMNRMFMDKSLPTECPRCHRETPTVPMAPKLVDRDATEPRLVAWAMDSEAALHHGGSTRMIQLNPAAFDAIVDDYGVGLTRRITSTQEFEGSQKVRDEGVDTIRRRWPDIRPHVRDRLVAWHEGELATAVGLTPSGAGPVLDPERLKTVLASRERQTASLGRHQAVASAGQRYGLFVIDDITSDMIYFHLPDRPLWRYEISHAAFRRHDPLLGEVVRQSFENTRWILFVTPFLLKLGAFGLGFSGRVAVVIAGIVLDEFAEEMRRDAEGKPARSPEEILGSAGTQFLIDRLFHRLLGGGGRAAVGAAGVAPKLAGRIEKMADKATHLVRRELAAAEKPLVKEALEHGAARRVTDDALKAEGYVLEVAVESGGRRHLYRMNKNGRWCRFSSPICELDLGSEVAAAARSPKSITAGQLEAQRELMKTIEDEIIFLDSVYQRMRQGGKMNVSLLSPKERVLLDSLAEHGDAAKLTLPELRAMARSPERARHFRAALDEEAELIKQLYREGRPLYVIMRAASPNYKSRSFVLREARMRDAVTGLAPPSGALDIDHVVPLNDIVRMPGFDKLRPERQLEIVNDVKNLRAVDNLANRSRGDRSWWDWPQAPIYYEAAAISRMRALEDELRTYIAGRIHTLSRP
jgi:hypothetical protein